MEFKIDLKKLNFVALIGIMMIFISTFLVHWNGAGLAWKMFDSERYIAFVSCLFALVFICINKYSIIVLIVGIINLIIAIEETIAIEDYKGMGLHFNNYSMASSYKWDIGLYLMWIGVLLTIISSIYWLVKANVKKGQINDEIDLKQTSNNDEHLKDNSKDNIRYWLIGVVILIVVFLTMNSSFGKWEEIGTLWKYKKVGIFDTKGLSKINGKYYYFDDNGYMTIGKQIVNNEFHYFNDDGSAREGWVQDGNVYHFCKEDGSIVKDTWIDANNNISTANSGTFYLDEYGNMVAGQSRVLNGKTYEFDSQGYKMFTFKVTNVYFNTSSDSKEKMNALNIHQTVCCHYTIECDEYGAEGQLYTVTYFPSGQSSKDKPSKCYAGDWSFSYPNGIYLNNADGPTGNLMVQFYDMKNRLIGQGSVLMTR